MNRTLMACIALAATGLAAAEWRSSEAPVTAAREASRAAVEGRVTGPGGRGQAGIAVTATRGDGVVSHTVLTDRQGRYDLGPLPAGRWRIRAHGPGIDAGEASIVAPADEAPELTISRHEAQPSELPSSAFLARLPDGEAKRRFILDCTGCHVFNEFPALPGGSPRTRDGWVEAVSRMLGFAGPNSGFPVISMGRQPEPTADLLTAAYPPGSPPALTAPAAVDIGVDAVVTEFAVPEPGDLPHDLAIDRNGRVIITGMFTHRMYVLDTDAGTFEFVPVPVTNANPRAVEIGPDGDWYVALGGPMRIAQYRVGTGEWQSWSAGMYAHSIGVDANGRIWFNGHFTRAPEQIGHVDPSSGAVNVEDVPPHPMAAAGFGPIPYELRVAPDGRVWMSELAGNRVIAFDPSAKSFRTYTMPTTFSGPRRLDAGPDDVIWIPEYSNNRLARLDPATGRIEEFELPVPDAAPYVARVDGRSGAVWIGTGAADALFRFDPATRRFTTYPLPTRGALVRHIAIDARNGDVWAAYGASPGIPSKVARLRIRG